LNSSYQKQPLQIVNPRKKSGAITASIRQISIEKTCFNDCFGFGVAQLVTRAGFELSFNYSTYYNCATFKDQQRPANIIYINGGVAYYSNCNASLNYAEAAQKEFTAIADIQSRGSLYISSSTFESNGYIPVLALLSITPFKTITRINFFNNTDTPDIAPGLIAVVYELTLSNCIIYKNNINSFFYAFDASIEDEHFLVRFLDCQIDSKAPQLDQEAQKYFNANADQFDKKDIKTFELDLLNNNVCKGHTIGGSSGSSIGTIIIIIIIILVAILAVFAILLQLSGGNINKLFDRFTKTHKKIPDYEIGLADIQVAQE